MGQIFTQGNIIEISQVKEFMKFGKQRKVANVVIETKNGKDLLTLWDEQIDLIKIGDKIKIFNGYLKEWKGQKSINVSKYGKIEILKNQKKAKK